MILLMIQKWLEICDQSKYRWQLTQWMLKTIIGGFDMKLVAIITDVNQKRNNNLIGQTIIVDSKLITSLDGELCYTETDDNIFTLKDRSFLQQLTLKHSVSNIEIIGVF